jgi:hypothetical protein
MKDAEFERRFLEFVYRTDLAITPGALAYYMDVPIAEAEGHLTKLVTREVVRMDVSQAGELVYSFPTRQRVSPPDREPRSVPVVQVGQFGQLGGSPLALVPVRPQPLAGSDDKVTCPYCGEAILAVAKKCKHCNEIIDPMLRVHGQGQLQVNVGLSPTLYRPRASSGVAALLSFFWPGAGHIYCGEVGAGLGWMMATFIGYVAFIVPGIILHICCIVAASNTAKRTA